MDSLSNKLAIGTAQFGLNYGTAAQNGKVNSNQIKSIFRFCSRERHKYIRYSQSIWEQ